MQVKLPTRPINSQIQLLRINGQQLTSINHTVHNQRVNFTTQQLGLYALVYGDKVTATTEATTIHATTTTQQQTLTVDKTKTVQKTIPNTGEKRNVLGVMLAIGLLALGALVIFGKKNNSNRDE